MGTCNHDGSLRTRYAVCLGEVGTVVAAEREGTAAVRFPDGTIRDVSTAVLVVDGVTIAPGDSILVSMGIALRAVPPHEHEGLRAWT